MDLVSMIASLGPEAAQIAILAFIAQRLGKLNAAFDFLGSRVSTLEILTAKRANDEQN